MILDVKEIAKVELKEDEYLFVKLPHPTSVSTIVAARKKFATFFGEKQGRVMVYTGDVELQRIKFNDKGDISYADDSRRTKDSTESIPVTESSALEVEGKQGSDQVDS